MQVFLPVAACSRIQRHIRLDMEKKKHPAGLTEAEAIESRRQHGTNILTPAAKIPLWKQFLEKFSDPIIRILLIALLASAAIAGFEYFHEGANQGDPGVFMEPVGILVAVLLATGIGFWFEVKANRAFDVLNEVNDEDAVQVIRDGSVREIAKKDVVVGDWVILNAGNEIPADGTLQEAVSLQVDESTLTGEPLVSKSVRPEDFDKEATYATNYVLRGTTVVGGHGLMCVEAVGDRTENGKVFVASQIDNSVKTPLNLQLEGLGNVITKISYVLAALIIIGRVVTFFSAGQGDPVAFVAYLLQTIMIAVTLIVVAVPEGLPMSVTLSLALSMRRMLRTHNLVRKMHACETMGATTVICTDKTGTLTQNQMRVHEMRLFEDADRPAGETARLAAEGIAVNSTAFLSEDDAEGNVKVMGNPTEGALLLFLRGEGADYAALREEAETISQLTFSTERKYMATVVRSGVKPGHYVLYVKGAPEIVLRLCRQTAGNISRDEIDHMLKTYQGQAMRTLGFAFQELDNDSRELFREGTLDTSAGAADGLTFVGLAAIADPVRKEVPGAVAACIGAGIDIKIVTGDTPGTAREIGRQIGLWQAADNVRNEITGPEFAALTDTELEERIMDLKIISRARPMDKKRLVETLQSKGQVVAVTGDGTNDAPALKAAHVGLSMGDGTSVAKEASDITIMDNSFSSITRAVMWGRSLYHNIQRFILFQMTINVAACLIVLAGAFLGTHSPLTVTQMLWVNLIMDTFAAMALASLPPTMDVMRDKPRRREDFIITPAMWRGILGTGVFFTLVLTALVVLFKQSSFGPEGQESLLGFAYGIGNRHELTAYEGSVFFTLFVMLQLWNLFNARAFETGHSAFHRMSRCRGFVLIVLLIFVGQVGIVTLGGPMFSVTPLSFTDWIVITLVTSPVLLIGHWRYLLPEKFRK